MTFLTSTIWMLPGLALASAVIYLPVYLIRRRRGRQPFLRHLTVWCFILYLLCLNYVTLGWYGIRSMLAMMGGPAYRLVNLAPFAYLRETYEMGFSRMAEQLLLNFLMTVPFGLLLPLACPAFRRLWKTGLLIAGVILLTETLQYFIGRSADIDDWILNTAGGLAGYGCYALLNRLLRNTPFWRAVTGGTAAASPEAPAREDPARGDPARKAPAREDPARGDPAREGPGGT